ncbi:MAG: nickel-dependent hydrogenase large subunit, partial [Methanomicrobia archaeon]|nr:nickel-dependent hydrogenase large subunit [Methanomicrobia archaeon]
RIERIQWQVSEAPRMFESFLRGKPYYEISHITSRICGICSIGHALCSLKATEAAMGIEISEQTLLLRKLALHAENIQSHILHIGYLVAPDLFRVGSVFHLVKTHKETVLKIIKLHRLANEMSDLICGRTTHPITLIPGGFTDIPSKKQLEDLRKKLTEIIPVCDDLSQVFLENIHMLPEFSRETEYIALTGDEYALYDGVIGSTDTGKHPIESYEAITNEFVVPHSTAKFARHARESYMVGALARFNLNSDRLSPMGKICAKRFGLKPVNYNPFMNNVAQLVEIYHCIEDSIDIVDKLLEKGLKKNDNAKYTVKAGRGIGAAEVPRGILFHDYTYNESGLCTKANLVIPTNQNHNNITKDLEAFVPMLLGKQEKEIELNLEMLVRAYDPCISCSTHYLKVEFKR